MRILVATNLFYPLYGGGEKALIEWLKDFQQRGLEVCVITTVPEVEGCEKTFPFEVIRLSEKIPWGENINDNGIQDYINNLNIDYYDLIYKGLERLTNMGDFDYCIGYGSWACDWDFGNNLTFAKLLKQKYPEVKTIGLRWDVHGGEFDYDTDFVLHGAPYEVINNPHHLKKDIRRFSIYPKQTGFDSIDKYDFEEWKSRPYDFIFNNPQLNKGSKTVLRIAKHYPQKKFLIKKGNWGSWHNDEINQLSLLHNVDMVERVDSMEQDFFRKGRYLLYPSISEGFGVMPLEAAMQGTIPLCSDIGILKYSSAPFAEFIYSDELNHNALFKMVEWDNYSAIDFDRVAEDWFKKINSLDMNPIYSLLIYNNLRYVELMIEDRYNQSIEEFISQLYEIKEAKIIE